MNTKKYIAEGLGTMALTLVVTLSLSGKFPVSTPVLAALCLGLFVYTIGHVSGCHINPAVTIGAWLIKKISGKDAILYIVSQFIGALVAMEIVLSTVGLAKIATPTSIIATVAEALGAFLFTFGIAAVVFEKSQKEFSGVIIGGSLFLGIAIAALMGSTGVLNPAVALGIGSFNWAYVIGPVLGAIFGMQAGKYLVG